MYAPPVLRIVGRTSRSTLRGACLLRQPSPEVGPCGGRRCAGVGGWQVEPVPVVIGHGEHRDLIGRVLAGIAFVGIYPWPLFQRALAARLARRE